MKCYAVVDTNVIVSALITKNPDSPPRQVFRAMLTGDIVPLYHPDRAEFVKNGKTERAENDFLVGLCDFALGGNYRFGAIVHPAIYGGLN